jgi:hypothetical protein
MVFVRNYRRLKVDSQKIRNKCIVLLLLPCTECTHLGWEPLQVRRVKIRLLLLFKTQHNLMAIPAEAYLLPSDSGTKGQNTFRTLVSVPFLVG